MISLENVTKIYEMGEAEVKALRGSSAEISEGEFIAVMGPSGSGKSTLMNMIGALDVPSSGSVKIGGSEISQMTEDQLSLLRREKIGFIFQQFNLIPNIKVWENVALPMFFSGVPRKQRRARAVDLLERVGLGDRVDFMPTELSGGQRQRVSIARALGNDPEIILADEPTGNLDSKTGKKIMNLLQELVDEGRTIIMVTHSEKDAEYADRVINIMDGKIGGELE